MIFFGIRVIVTFVTQNGRVAHNVAGILKKISGLYSENQGFLRIFAVNKSKKCGCIGYKYLSAAPCDTPNSAPQKVFGIRTYAINHYVDRAFV